MARILITPRSLTSAPPPELDALTAAGHELVFSAAGAMPGEAELLELVPEVDGWLAGVEPISPAVIAAASKLRVISRNGSGADNIPMADTKARGISVERAMAANATGVAELAIGLALSACRHLPEVAAGVRIGAWPRPRGREIEGATVGIVGLGAIGRKVAGVMARMGAHVIGVDPLQPDLGNDRIEYVGLPELARRAEIISLHCPMPAGNRPMFDSALIGQLQPSAVVINTARAGLVDEAAMREALDDSRVSVYATDVFSIEPPEPGGLASHPRVIATSHIGGLTSESVSRTTRIAVDNLLAHLGKGAGNAAG